MTNLTTDQLLQKLELILKKLDFKCNRIYDRFYRSFPYQIVTWKKLRRIQINGTLF